MKRVAIILFLFSLLTFQCRSDRSDKLFSAFDEFHYLMLYEEGHEFEILYNGLNTATGTYRIENDTIRLTYNEDQFEEFDPHEKLTRQVLIDKESNRVKSIDDKMQFCANIAIDKRKTKN